MHIIKMLNDVHFDCHRAVRFIALFLSLAVGDYKKFLLFVFSCFSPVSLKPELFEGLRFDFTKPLSPKSLSHRQVGT